MKKLLKFIFPFAAALALLAGCGDNDPYEENSPQDDVQDEQQDVKEEEKDVKEEQKDVEQEQEKAGDTVESP